MKKLEVRSSKFESDGHEGTKVRRHEVRGFKRFRTPSSNFELRTSNLMVLGLCGSVFVSGCFQPIGGPRKKPTASAAHSKRRAQAESSAAVADSAKSFAVERMTVQTETVEAGEVWRGHRDEIDEKARIVSNEDLRQFVAQRSAELITDKIAEMLLYQKAALRQTAEMETRIDAYVDGEIRKIVTAKHEGLQRRYEKYLNSQGTTLEETRTTLRRQFVIAGFLESEVRPKVAEPTRADLVEVFEANQGNWAKPERRSMSLIDIRAADLLPEGVNDPSREQLAAAREEARTRANAALAELRSGADFAELARRYSHGAKGADGGAWGWIEAEDVRERFLPAIEALNKLSAGRVSDVIETPEGFFIVRCDAFEPAVTPEFESAQPQLKELVFRRMYNHLVSDLIAELRGKSRIEPANLDRFHAAVAAAGMALLGAPR